MLSFGMTLQFRSATETGQMFEISVFTRSAKPY
jgi:hypothetical protein